MEEPVPYSSYWGRLKHRRSINEDIVEIIIGSHSVLVFRDDPFLPMLRERKVKKKVFLVVDGGVTVVEGEEEFVSKSYHVVTIMEVQITDSYSLVSRFREFWKEEALRPLHVAR